MRHVFIHPTVVLAVLLGLTCSTAAQCPPQWSQQFVTSDSEYANCFAWHDDDGAGPHPAALYAGVSDTIGGINVNRIAKWNGAIWEPLGDGLEFGSPEAMMTFDTDGAGPQPPALIVGGSFETAGGLLVNNIAKWDGNAWSPLGAGFNAGVNCLAVYDPDGDGPSQPSLYAAGSFTESGNHDIYRIARWTGSAWTTVGSQAGAVQWISALKVFDPDDDGPILPTLVVGGSFTAIGGVLGVNHIAQWNGSTWSAMGGGMSAATNDVIVFDDDANGPNAPAIYAGGNFVSAGGTTVNFVARWDGATWQPLDNGFENAVYALGVLDDGVSGSTLYAGGQFISADGIAMNHIAKWDGIAWSEPDGGLTSSSSPPVHAMITVPIGLDGAERLVVGGPFVYAGPVAAAGIALWDGQSWSVLGQGIQDCYAASCFRSTSALIVWDDDGEGPNAPALFVGGEFTTIGSTLAQNIAKWNGENWTALGAGLNGEVRAMTVFDDDGAGSSAPALFVSGFFTMAGDVSASGIAKWDGSSWSALGSGMSGARALTVYDDGLGGGPQLIAGGSFSSAGGQSANNIARWNGSSWSPLGSGVTGGIPGNPVGVWALTVVEDGAGDLMPGLYVGGRFNVAGTGVVVNNLARWDGQDWFAVGGGVQLQGSPARVMALEDFEGERQGLGQKALYVGGIFDTAGGISAIRIAKWTGSVWSDLDVGMSYSFGAPSVAALRIFNDGSGAGPQLYAGGIFSAAGGVEAHFVAKWDGSDWSAIDTGLDDAVTALAEFDDDSSGPGPPGLFVTGKFNTAGALSSGRVARWGPLSTPNITEQPSNVSTNAGRSATLHVEVNGSPPFSYQWRKDGAPLQNGPRIAGAHTALLTIEPATASDSGDYDVLVTNQCDSVQSQTALVSVQPYCPADLATDGVVDVNDLLELINAWGPCDQCSADITGDSSVDVADLLILINAWGSCP